MIKTNPLSISDINKIASEFRSKYKINNQECFPIFDILDDLFIKGSLSYMLVDDCDFILPKDTPAIYNANENFIYINEKVFEEYENENYRSAFTLAHELFHYFQAQVLKFDFEEVNNCKSYEDPEWQANEFAGQLLIPEEYVSLPEDEIVKRYHVSLECALTRKAKMYNRKNFKKEKEYV